jgi:hypothetical protein
MVGDYHWTIYGAILAVLGIAQVIWSNTRQIKALSGEGRPLQWPLASLIGFGT